MEIEAWSYGVLSRGVVPLTVAVVNDRKHEGSIWGVHEYKTTWLTKDYIAKLHGKHLTK